MRTKVSSKSDLDNFTVKDECVQYKCRYLITPQSELVKKKMSELHNSKIGISTTIERIPKLFWYGQEYRRQLMSMSAAARYVSKPNSALKNQWD